MEYKCVMADFFRKKFLLRINMSSSRLPRLSTLSAKSGRLSSYHEKTLIDRDNSNRYSFCIAQSSESTVSSYKDLKDMALIENLRAAQI